MKKRSKHASEIARLKAEKGILPYGLVHKPGFLSPSEREDILAYLRTLYPIREQRYSDWNPPPEGESQRWLLRPVYWLGNWQFACLDYFHPPKTVENCCVTAEEFPAPLKAFSMKCEAMARETFRPEDIPEKWELNTCLINYYGWQLGGEKREDTARVGEHKDFEPGPVASLSLGAKALFQFVASSRRGERDGVELQQWLGDGDLQMFAGTRFKDRLFHRVQRVERDEFPELASLNTPGFLPRRINFTFRYVPRQHFVRFRDLPQGAAESVRGYMTELAKHSVFFRGELAAP